MHFGSHLGYIAHNDELIVVSFRCTTSLFDWLTNLNSTTSAWEVEDYELGYSGICSGFSGLCFQGPNAKPRVHTGMYNNFLAILPEVKKHVDKYLKKDEKPRELYIVGHSLGAGIANLMATYFLLEGYDWNVLPQKLISVTAGSPRSNGKSMKKVTDEKRLEFGKNVRFHRLVKGKDAVSKVPPRILGFEHIVDPIVITDDGKILMLKKEDGLKTDLSEAYKVTRQKDAQFSVDKLVKDGEDTKKTTEKEGTLQRETSTEKNDEEEYAKYQRLVTKIPKGLRDHMPDFYLKPIFNAQGIEHASKTKPTK